MGLIGSVVKGTFKLGFMLIGAVWNHAQNGYGKIEQARKESAGLSDRELANRFRNVRGYSPGQHVGYAQELTDRIRDRKK